MLGARRYSTVKGIVSFFVTCSPIKQKICSITSIGGDLSDIHCDSKLNNNNSIIVVIAEKTQ